MSNEGADEKRANEREHHQNQDKDECKIRADIFHVVVSAPHLVLGDNIPGVEEEWVFDVAIAWRALRLQQHELALIVQMQGQRLIDIGVTTVILVHSFNILKQNLLRPNPLQSQHLLPP